MEFQVLSCLAPNTWYNEKSMNKDICFGASSMIGELLLWDTKKKIAIMETKKILKGLWRESYKTC